MIRIEDDAKPMNDWDLHRIRGTLRAATDKIPGAMTELRRNAPADLALLLAELDAERAAHELEKRAHERNWQRMRERTERAEKAERERDDVTTAFDQAVALTIDLQASLEKTERERDAERAAFSETSYRLTATLIDRDDARRERDAALAMVEGRPEITPEDAAKWLAYLSDVYPRNKPETEAIEHIESALRAHAKKGASDAPR